MRVKTGLSLRQRRMLGEDRWKMAVAVIAISLSGSFAYAGIRLQAVATVRESIAEHRREVPLE